jgi:uncharacterized protein (DUF952 family)
MKNLSLALAATLLSSVCLLSGCSTTSVSAEPAPATQSSAPAAPREIDAYLAKYPYIYHLVQKRLWNEALRSNSTYFPPTYEQDGFTHATANPDFLLTIGNHFYREVPGDWLSLRMSVDSLAATGVQTIFEGTAPVGDTQPDFDGADSELFPHILGGIDPAAVLQAHEVSRAADGRFLGVSKVVGDTTLYHIVSEKELQALTRNNVYMPESVALEGYIHFSQLQLILPIANDAYADRDVLYLLQVTFKDTDKDLRWIGDNPDYYRGLDLAMVDQKIQFVRGANGLWAFPEGFR